jgi:menaquinol-cytochrome c reductase iron-sulfur subunit
LKWATAIVAGVVAVLAGIPALSAFLSPAFRRRATTRWIKIGEADLFDVDVPTQVSFSETINDAWVQNRALRNVWVYTQDGEHFTVYSGRCPHLGCAYRFDKDPDPAVHHESNVFHCPCHHGVFDLKTGAVLAGPPPRGLDALATKLEGGMLYVAYEDFRVGIAERVAV